jgi:hypothetical protein
MNVLLFAGCTGDTYIRALDRKNPVLGDTVLCMRNST